MTLEATREHMAELLHAADRPSLPSSNGINVVSSHQVQKESQAGVEYSRSSPQIPVGFSALVSAGQGTGESTHCLMSSHQRAEGSRKGAMAPSECGTSSEDIYATPLARVPLEEADRMSVWKVRRKPAAVVESLVDINEESSIICLIPRRWPSSALIWDIWPARSLSTASGSSCLRRRCSVRETWRSKRATQCLRSWTGIREASPRARQG